MRIMSSHCRLASLKKQPADRAEAIRCANVTNDLGFQMSHIGCSRLQCPDLASIDMAIAHVFG